MNKHYEAPEVIETRFAVEDVITTSGGIVLPDDDWE